MFSASPSHAAHRNQVGSPSSQVSPFFTRLVCTTVKFATALPDGWNFNSGSLARLPTIVTIGSPLIAVLLGCGLAAPALRRPLHVEVAKPRRAHQSGVPAHGLGRPAQVAQRGHGRRGDAVGGTVGVGWRAGPPTGGAGRVRP